MKDTVDTIIETFLRIIDKTNEQAPKPVFSNRFDNTISKNSIQNTINTVTDTDIKES